ncbi:MAG: ATP-binding protein [Actinomycetia bacterium]|nr:ATP-binding protein [Actinomycetes bacterium]
MVRHWLTTTHREALVEDALLITSELVTNGYEETLRVHPNGTFSLLMFLVQQKVVLQVWDCSTRRPVTRAEDLGAETGRGLVIAAALAESVGCEVFPGQGKCVWAVIR